jgi:hypothetical protein
MLIFESMPDGFVLENKPILSISDLRFADRRCSQPTYRAKGAKGAKDAKETTAREYAPDTMPGQVAPPNAKSKVRSPMSKGWNLNPKSE